MKHVVIIGNGVSGITAARHIRKNSDCKITVISTETDYFFSRTALMYIYMGHMKFEHTQPYEPWFWEKNRIDLLRAYVQKVDTDAEQLHLDNGNILAYDDLIIASGSKSNKFGWKGQDLPGVQGLYSYQDLELLEENTKNGINRAVIVGGGLIGIELAEMLASRGYPVTILIREKSFWNNVLPPGESELINRHIAEHHIELRKEENLVEIVADENGRACKVITDKGEIECQLVGLTAGVGPNISFLEDSNIETERGVMVNEFLETNIPNVYALGDCAQFHKHPKSDRRNLEQVWYTGRMMGETVAQTITGKRATYNPGNWFNSAKFLDIEYQTYGWVFSELRDGESDFYWEHSNGKMCVHIVYNTETKEFLGLNTFGIRMRHEQMDKILNEKKTVEYVLEHLNDINFDPEFYKNYGTEIIAKYNQETGSNLKLKKKSLLNIFG